MAREVTDWISLIVQPTTVAGVGLLVLVVLLFRKGKRQYAVRWLAGSIVAVYFTFATPAGANALVGLLEERAPPAGCTDAIATSVLVVLAGGMTGEPGDDQDYAHLTVSTLRRVMGAVKLGQTLSGSTLIMSGGAGRSVREADLMASLARALGMDANRIIVDRESRSTYESAARTPSLLLPLSGRPVSLVTSAMHMPRAMAAFRSAGVAACPYAVDRQLIRPALHEALVPQLSALVKGSSALHEVLGYLGYWATGKI